MFIEYIYYIHILLSYIITFFFFPYINVSFYLLHFFVDVCNLCMFVTVIWLFVLRCTDFFFVKHLKNREYMTGTSLCKYNVGSQSVWGKLKLLFFFILNRIIGIILFSNSKETNIWKEKQSVIDINITYVYAQCM